MKTNSRHRKSGRHSKGSRDKTLTERHYDGLCEQVKRLEAELKEE